MKETKMKKKLKSRVVSVIMTAILAVSLCGSAAFGSSLYQKNINQLNLLLPVLPGETNPKRSISYTLEVS